MPCRHSADSGHVVSYYLYFTSTEPCSIHTTRGQYGFFRSDDAAKSWVRINDEDHQYGLVLHIIGDMQEYGRVYVGTHGRGIITGQKTTSASQK